MPTSATGSGVKANNYKPPTQQAGGGTGVDDRGKGKLGVGNVKAPTGSGKTTRDFKVSDQDGALTSCRAQCATCDTDNKAKCLTCAGGVKCVEKRRNTLTITIY
jgi:hypothetical protein